MRTIAVLAMSLAVAVSAQERPGWKLVWADEFDNSTLEQKKMIVCQLVKEIRIARGYKIEMVFDINYEQFIADAQ